MITISWVSPRTWVSGEVVTAALMNTHVRDNLNFVATFISTGTLGTNSVLLGAGTGPVGTLTLGQLTIPIGSATAQPTAIAVFTGGGPASALVKSAFGGVQADVSAGTKGAVLAGSSTGVYNALTRGADGQILKADSTQALGVKWANEQVLNLIVSGSGSGAAGTAFATGTVSGLNPHDMVIVYYEIRPAAGSADQILIMQGTSSATLIPLLANGTLGNGSIAVGQVVIRMLATGTESFAQLIEVRGATGAYLVGAGTNVTGYHQATLPVAWTGSFIVSLFAVGSATLDYRWRVYKQPGT